MTKYTTTDTTGGMPGGYTFPTAYTIGFDRLFDQMTTASLAMGAQNNYPPHNIVKVDDDHYVVELAVAGFKQEDLNIEFKDSVLTITGKKEDNREYTHKGISSREFKRTFTLGEYVEAISASLADGILSVNLERIIPEEKRPKKIEIGSATKTKKGFLKD